jgi:hypothetical protein
VIQIIVILAVAYILVPLFDLTLAERIRYFAKTAIYIVALVWLIYTLWLGGVRL